MKQRLLDLILHFLVAQATPYFHLYGYMMRWWLVPYNTVIERTWTEDFPGGAQAMVTTTDGTGMVSPWKRPFTWLIQKCGIAVRVHEILRSDLGRDPHNHPWPYVTIILRGGYYETRYNSDGSKIDTKWHGPGSILYRPANSWHRLDLPALPPSANGPAFEKCTTLFFTGEKVQRWGFMTKDGFVPYNKYAGRND